MIMVFLNHTHLLYLVGLYDVVSFLLLLFCVCNSLLFVIVFSILKYMYLANLIALYLL